MPTAQYNLGVMYADGRGVAKDAQQAVVWYRKAADQGDADAQNNLGVMYANGAGVPKDAQQAYFWWLLSSAQGETSSAKNRDLVALRLTPAQRAQAHDKAREWKPKQ